MDAAHEAHLQRILTSFQREATDKYRAGQAAHGGELWRKPHLLDEAIAEAIDQVIYLFTLREQIQGRDRTIGEYRIGRSHCGDCGNIGTVVQSAGVVNVVCDRCGGVAQTTCGDVG